MGHEAKQCAARVLGMLWCSMAWHGHGVLQRWTSCLCLGRWGVPPLLWFNHLPTLPSRQLPRLIRHGRLCRR